MKLCLFQYTSSTFWGRVALGRRAKLRREGMLPVALSRERSDGDATAQLKRGELSHALQRRARPWNSKHKPCWNLLFPKQEVDHLRNNGEEYVEAGLAVFLRITAVLRFRGISSLPRRVFQGTLRLVPIMTMHNNETANVRAA